MFYKMRSWGRQPTVLGWQAHVTTVAGDGTPAFRDGKPASFAEPFGIVVAPDGTVYVSDAGESNRIRKIAPDGSVSTFAGATEGFADGPGGQAAFNTPSGLALDSLGNLYVADTSNHRIRKVTPQGSVLTIAGDGNAGYLDGPAAQARFDGPVGVAVDGNGNVYVADTYNDRIRKISVDGQVSTIAGPGSLPSAKPGYADGPAGSALFDTPCAVAVAADGTLIVADTGNNRLRKITLQGEVTTLPVNFPNDVNPADLRKPLGLAITRDGFLYVTELDRSRIVQLSPDGSARVIAGGNPGFENGDSRSARFNQTAGIALDQAGNLYVADSANYFVRKLSAETDAGSANASELEFRPHLTPEVLGQQSLLWPLDPQDRPHEVVATIGEVRGNYDSDDSRERLHSGLDIFGNYDQVVRAIRSEKVTSPIPNWGFGELGEGLRVGVISYIHMHIGRDKDGKMLADPRFVQVFGDDGKLSRIRVRRGTRFTPGDALGTVNRMYHVHLNVGPPRDEYNPLSFSLAGFVDRVAPIIEKDGVQLFSETGVRFEQKQADGLLVNGHVRIIVEAFDRNDMNPERRRLGLYRLGYQILRADGSQVPGFEQPRFNIEFNRLPGTSDAPKLTYAEDSGITVYGSATTRFRYEITNVIRDGHASRGVWDTSELASGAYILRVIVGDYSGNETTADVSVSVH
jgi:sugar lactone lactonase YvrE